MKTRLLTAGSVSFLFLSPALIGSCSEGISSDPNGAGGSVVATGGSSVGVGGLAAPGSGSSSSSTGGSSVSVGGSGNSGVGGGAGTGGSRNAGGSTGSGGSSQVPCTDIQLPDHEGEPCSQWAEWGQCGESYVLDYCDRSCGRCTDDGNNSGSGGAGNNGSGGGGNNASGGGGNNGDANPWGNVTGGQNGWASRYWDCCKQSCAWSENAGGNPVKSCDASGNNKVGADSQSACSGGSSTTCNSFVPQVYSSAVSFGMVATHAGSGVPCGQCYQLQFTGSSHNGGADPGSQALKDKVMIVMSTNIGGDVSSDGQLDLLVPGGGTGAFYGCGSAWGVQQGSSELGAQYGGLRSGCNGDLNSIKSCVSQKCQSLFGSRGLEEMYEGCMWYVDWFEAADNPNFVQKQVDCPQEMRSMAF